MVQVQSEVHLTTPVLSDPLMCVLRAAHRPDSHLLGINEVVIHVCACMPSFVGKAARPRLFCSSVFGSRAGKLQNAHVPAHSITDIELFGNFSTVMGLTIYMDIDFGKYMARRRTEGG